jgi:phage shock protein A
LLNQIQQLKQENQVLRTKIVQKEITHTQINTKNSSNTAIGKVNSLLTHSNVSTMQALKSKCEHLQANSYQDLSNKVINYFEKAKTNTNSHHIHSQYGATKLTKNVYMDKPPIDKHCSL